MQVKINHHTERRHEIWDAADAARDSYDMLVLVIPEIIMIFKLTPIII